MVRVSAVTRIERATGESNLAERAQTLEFGCLIHRPSLERSFREFPAKYGPLGRRCKPAAEPDVVKITPSRLTAGNLPLAF